MRALLLVALMIGCVESKPPPCGFTPQGAAAIAQEQLRDPSSGQCVSFGGGPTCNNQCGPCPAGAVGAAPAQPDWGSCFGPCESLSETQCLATANCHAAYQDDSAQKPVFWGCWDMPPSGTLHGSCTGLDAQTCLEHDDCTSLYTGPVNQPPNFVPSFESCQPEVMAPACATLTTEAACKARTDCTPVYNGTNCTCTPQSCTCQTETFAYCQ